MDTLHDADEVKLHGLNPPCLGLGADWDESGRTHRISSFTTRRGNMDDVVRQNAPNTFRDFDIEVTLG